VAKPEAEQPATFAAGFEFARRLRDPEFRALLERHHWRPGERVVMADGDEPIVDVISRMVLHETGSRAFIAIPDQREPHGFRFLTVETVEATADNIERPDLVQLAPGASVGMLYAALQPCGAYVPSDWTGPLLFGRVTQPA
jgi:hypothetical protein